MEVKIDRLDHQGRGIASLDKVTFKSSGATIKALKDNPTITNLSITSALCSMSFDKSIMFFILILNQYNNHVLRLFYIVYFFILSFFLIKF